ncbi:sensor histidine kinase [uncultured Phenylobacterium sp.]|uniref:sensor histidine kinase n=1 Tax=uncultured Phenylobacterium sp. TaxID=349273 RepID=UPI0025E30949|nr:sensor histidine kinase [uncultured Phenylobacterium sp.]
MFTGAANADTGLARELSSARARLASQERQIQELNHRVANSLQLAADMLTFEQLRSRDPSAQAALEASRARLVAVGELHRYLYDHADRPNVELRPFLTGLCQAVAATTGLSCTIDADAVTVNGDMAQQLAIAINEFAINAAKHAYNGAPGGRLDITCRRDGAELVLSVADHGPGLAADARPGGAGGLGMSIVAAIVRDLRGALSVRSDDGAVFTIRAPLPAAPATFNRSFRPSNPD